MLLLDRQRGRTDAMRFIEAFPGFQDMSSKAFEVRSTLAPLYADYISSVSNEVMAISLELEGFLSLVCNVFKPRRILDLGSGFSSTVFRSYQAGEPKRATVCTVDDSVRWLDKTRDFLDAHQLPSDHMISWESFLSHPAETYDLVLHDLGTMDTRERTLQDALRSVCPNGLVVLDDMHILRYRGYAMRILSGLPVKHYSLRSFTEDRYGRYAELVVPKSITSRRTGGI